MRNPGGRWTHPGEGVIYLLRLEDGSLSGPREDDRPAVSPASELSVQLLPPLAASRAALLPHALRVLRDAPAETAAFRRLSQLLLFLSALAAHFSPPVSSL